MAGDREPGKRLRGIRQTCSKLIPQFVCTLWSLLIGRGGQQEKERPHSLVEIGGMYVKMLWDSGSQISLIDHRIMSQICKAKPNNVKRLPKPQVTLCTADGKPLQVLSMYSIKFQTEGQTLEAPFYVVKNLRSSMIAGCDLMEMYNVTLDMLKRKVHIGKLNISQQKLDIIKVTLRSNKQIKLNPQEEKRVFISLPPELNNEKEILFENSPKSDLSNQIVVPEALCKVTWQNFYTPGIYLVFVNTSKDFYTISKHDIIGAVSKGSCVKAYSIESITKDIHIQSKKQVFKEADLKFGEVPTHIRQKYVEMVNDFADVFSQGKLDVGNCPIMPHVIKLKDPTKIVSIPPYRMPYHLQSVASDYVDNLLKANVIRKSTSPFSSPLMLVRKQHADPSMPITHQYRVVHNYKKVNENIERCAYPLRNLYELIDNVSKGRVYTVIDLSQGYFNQQCIDKHGATAFSLPGKGHFEYVKSPMGINSSPAFFQRLLDFITQGIKNVYVYMDDVIISTQTHEKNLLALKETLTRFRQYKVKCNLSKTTFGADRVEYLGYDISHKFGIRPGKLKTDAIKNCKPPTSVTEIKQFLGLCSFFRRVVPRFSFFASPLTKLTRKDSGYKNGPLPKEAQEAFLKLQNALVSRPCVAPVDFDLPFIVTVDTSQTATGAILSQKPPRGPERANAFFSAVLSDCDSRKSAYHREQLGILYALRHFKPYLFGKEFILRTDHKPLAVNQTGKIDVLDRIGEAIKQFQPFKMEYMKGTIIPSDYLSRPNDETRKNLKIASPIEEFQLINDKALYEAQKEDTRIKAIAVRLLTKQWPKSQILNSFVRTWVQNCRIDEGLVKDKNGRILVPTSLKPTILKTYHDQLGHRNANTTLDFIAKSWVWPEMKMEIENYVKSCDTCGRVKPPHKYQQVALRPFQPATQFNQRLHIDCLTNLPYAKSNNHTAVVIIVDAYSGYVMTKSIQKPNASSILRVLTEHWIPAFSTPMQLISDGGREFQNNVIKELCEKLNIEHIITSPHHSRSNGMAERKVRQVVEFLRMYTNPGREGRQEWNLLLPHFDLFTNVAKTVRGFSPHFLVFLTEPRIPMDKLDKYSSYAETEIANKLLLMKSVAQYVVKEQKSNFERNKYYHDKRAIDLLLHPGDKVYLNEQGHLTKLEAKYSGPYLVIEDLGDHVLIKAPHKTKIDKVHKDRIKLGTLRDFISDVPNQFLENVRNNKQPAKPLNIKKPAIMDEPIFEDDPGPAPANQIPPAQQGAPHDPPQPPGVEPIGEPGADHQAHPPPNSPGPEPGPGDQAQPPSPPSPQDTPGQPPPREEGLPDMGPGDQATGRSPARSPAGRSSENLPQLPDLERLYPDLGEFLDVNQPEQVDRGGEHAQQPQLDDPPGAQPSARDDGQHQPKPANEPLPNLRGARTSGPPDPMVRSRSPTPLNPRSGPLPPVRGRGLTGKSGPHRVVTGSGAGGTRGVSTRDSGTTSHLRGAATTRPSTAAAAQSALSRSTESRLSSKAPSKSKAAATSSDRVTRQKAKDDSLQVPDHTLPRVPLERKKKQEVSKTGANPKKK